MLKSPQNLGVIHFIGIGGIGMSGIAEILFQSGYQVQGSDLNISNNTIRLEKLGIKIYIGQKKSNIINAKIVVVSTAISEINKEYVDAARCLAFSNTRIMFKHILPNCMAPLIVVGTLQTAHAISLEATLSFLGLGLPITEPSLGLLIGNGFEYMYSGDYWISIFPGVALLITVASINLVGDHLRDMFNPRLH